MKQQLSELKLEIQEKGLHKIKAYFDFTPEELENLDTEVLKHLYNMAKLGMTFEREMNISLRSQEMNYLRISKVVSDSKEEIKRYIRKSMPQYF